MPHKRKPTTGQKKRQENQSTEHEKAQGKAQKRQRISEDQEEIPEPDNSHQSEPKLIANVKGEKIYVQTRIDKLAKTMNRPSAFIRLDATDFTSRFKRLWDEHIEGFTGLRGSKRERTEKEKQMEWRQRVKALAEKKQTIAQVKKNGQTVSEADRLLAIQRYREMKAKSALAPVAAN